MKATLPNRGPRPAILPTLQDHLEARRNCRFRLEGVLVEHLGRVVAIRSTRWDADGDLAVTLADGAEAHPSDLALRSTWPVACCRPSVARLRKILARRAEEGGHS